MKAEGFKRITAIWLCSMMLLGSTPFLMGASDSGEAKVIVRNGTAYNVTTPFRINSNADFATDPHVSAGNGTVWAPWVIENYEINGEGFGYCIYIGNTTDYFTVKDSYLNNASQNVTAPYYGSGLIFYNVQNGVIDNTIFYRNDNSGIYFINSNNNTINKNNLSLNGWYGIYFSSSNSNVIIENYIYRNFWRNVMMDNSSKNYFAKNNIDWGEFGGIYLKSSSNFNVIENSTFSNVVFFGLETEHSDNNTIANNSFLTGSWPGIEMSMSCNNSLINNNLTGMSINIDGDKVEYWNSHDIDSTNVINGKPVCYLKNQIGGMTPLGAGELILANCSQIVVKDQIITNGFIGILFGFSCDNSIINNTVSNHRFGYGICLSSSDNNTIFNNIMAENEIGLYMECSNNNAIFNNTYSFNDYLGTYIYCSNNNKIYHNNFLYNDIQFYENDNNFLYLDYPVGGNYWSDHYGSDIFSGVNQDAQCSDGIVDTPYYFNTTEQDRYPLVRQYNGVEIRAITPFDGETNVNISAGTCNIQFSERMNISVGSVLTNLPVALWTWSANGLWLNGTYNNLTYNTSYFVNLADMGFKDVFGNILTGDMNKSFMTRFSSSCHEQIRINSNADFASMAASEGLTGDGTQTSPWLIKGYDITGTGYGYCIYIGNTTNYFIIENCTLYDATGNYHWPYFVEAAIHLYKVENGAIKNCTITKNDNGIYLYYTNRTTINNNNLSNNSFGIYFRDTSNYNLIVNNSFFNCEGGIYISYHSSNNTISNNTASDNGVCIYCSEDSSYNYILNNTLINNSAIDPEDGGAAIVIYESNYNTILYNNASNNSYGIAVGGSNNNTILNNTVANNFYGLYMWYTASNVLYHNAFINNSNQFFGESNNYNIWNSSYPIGGNYWSDYIGHDIESGIDQDRPGSDGFGDTPYSVDSTNQDRYPLISPEAKNDIIKPTSRLDNISSNWVKSIPVILNATANDTRTSLANVTLYYMFQSTNITSSNWAIFGTDTDGSDGWSWTFDFPEGEGNYQFYSIATDFANNIEDPPASPDISIGYDITPPTSQMEQPNFWQSDRCLILDWTVNDIGCGVEESTILSGSSPPIELHPGVDIWMRYSPDNLTWGDCWINWTNWATLDSGANRQYEVTNDGWYQFYTMARDIVGNQEIPKDSYDAYFACDGTPPVANIYLDQAIYEYSTITFDASNSSDNIQITNYTWFLFNDTNIITLYGEAPSYNFSEQGDYLLILTVSDNANNLATKTVSINVLGLSDNDNDGIPDIYDPDDDNDGVPDTEDLEPFNSDIGRSNYLFGLVVFLLVIVLLAGAFIPSRPKT